MRDEEKTKEQLIRELESLRAEISQITLNTADVEDLKDLKDSLQNTRYELNSLKVAIDEAAIVAITDTKGTITYVNKKFCEISKYSAGELIGQNHRIINSGYHPREFFRDMWQTIVRGRVWRNQIRNRAKDGSLYWVDTTIVPLTNRDGQNTNYLAIRFDITEQKQTEEKLEKTIEELSASKSRIEEQSRIQNELNIRLKESEEKLIELNANKDKFFSILAHDLKNPFSSLLNTASFLNQESASLSRDEIEELIPNMYKSAENLYNLLENLLKWSQLQTGRMILHPRILKLSDLAKTAAGLFTQNAGEKGIKIICNIKDGIFVLADENMAASVFQNLLSNAVKFTGKGGVVEISADRAGEYVKITIRDSGTGMDGDTLEKLFRIEQQVSTSGTANEKGTGLGLKLVKEMVEKNGGTIIAESKPGEGSLFTIYFPAAGSNEFTSHVKEAEKDDPADSKD